MREILFRGKRVDGDKWIKGSLWNNYGEVKILSDLNAVGYEVIPETVGQYTGLHDATKWESLTEKERQEFLRNHKKEEWKGRQIFEGDIVCFITCSYHFKKFRNCRIEYRPCYGRYCAIDNYGYEYPMDKTFEYEVIGNIHDNPELLKGDKDNG